MLNDLIHVKRKQGMLTYKGKYHCMAAILFYLFGFSCFVWLNYNRFASLADSNPSKQEVRHLLRLPLLRLYWDFHYLPLFIETSTVSEWVFSELKICHSTVHDILSMISCELDSSCQCPKVGIKIQGRFAQFAPTLITAAKNVILEPMSWENVSIAMLCWN